ncbi:MAG: class I SAM-dependent methyltransferase [Candidatus Portnoybacteria bacterium]|nr:class I SAM-dependent methyltransferase [Candidatus Portnoybacteria bacterium]
MINKILDLYKKHIEERQYFTKSRLPFYELTKKYLPPEKDAVVIDIGCGDYNRFDEGLDKKYKIYNLDKVEGIAINYPNTYHYIAPDRLPFDDNSVDFIHCSHLIEHLSLDNVYELLKEFDRVLKNNGAIVISAPLFTRTFLEHPTHCKVYTPSFLSLCLVDRRGTGNENADSEIISENFKVEEVVYRYSQLATERIWYSKYFIIDLLIKILLRFAYFLGFRKFNKDAYTMVLRKN